MGMIIRVVALNWPGNINRCLQNQRLSLSSVDIRSWQVVFIGICEHKALAEQLAADGCVVFFRCFTEPLCIDRQTSAHPAIIWC